MVDRNEDGLGEALRVVERITREAQDIYSLGHATAPEGAVGLPAKVPYIERHGASPSMLSFKPLLEEWRTAPARRTGMAKTDTLRAFIDLTCRHKDEHSVLFAAADWPNPSLTAVIDYHQTTGEARFGQHRIFYAFPLTREFKSWVDHDGKAFNQFDFAEFIEANIMDLSVPLDGERTEFEALFRTKFAVPTDLIALARGLEINVNAKVKNAYKLGSGEAEIRFEEEHRGADGEPVHVPGLFMLSCRAFVDGSEVRLPAKLRYRVKEGIIVWTYHLYKWEDALRGRVAADLAIATAQTGLPAFEGAPER